MPVEGEMAGHPPTPRAIGGAFLEFVPFGLTKAVTVVLHIETLNMPGGRKTHRNPSYYLTLVKFFHRAFPLTSNPGKSCQGR
jgi:hypothetical protein